MKIEWSQVAIALSLGLLIGTGAGRWAVLRRLEEGHKKRVERFVKELRLDAAQRPKVEAILDAKREKMKALRDKVRPQYEALRASTSQELRAVLRPEQIPALERIEARMKERIERRRARLDKD